MVDQKTIEFVKQIFNNYNSGAIEKNDTKYQSKRDKLISEIAFVIDEVLNYEKVDIDDLEYIDEGATSKVFLCGSKIIKLGKKRFTVDFPRNPYVLTPLIKKEFIFEGDKYIEGLFLEVTQKVDTTKQATEDELYELYANLRDLGIEWLDIENRNVGFLLEDNNVQYDMPFIYDENNVPLENETVLKKGQLVILDTDFIYKEEDVPEELFHMDEDQEYGFIQRVKKFRKRYNEERNKKR